jgi:hypothetical protein
MDMAESEKRYTLVEGTPEEHAEAIDKARRGGGQMRFNREWLFMALVVLGVAGYALYSFIYPLLHRGP